MNDRDAVREYYSSFAEREWKRLENPSDGAIEFALTTRMLTRHLPPSGRVLDLGGGPGRYAIWLGEREYRVTLADLSTELLDIARDRLAVAGIAGQMDEVVETDACDLGRWTNASFDAALCLGPFYHLPEAADRQRAAAELHRVLKPGAITFVAFMSRYALIQRTIAIPDERRHLLDEDWMRALIDHGRFINDIPGRFDRGFGARPEEIAPAMEASGFETVALVGLEGMARPVSDALGEIGDAGGALSERLVSLFEELSFEPSVMGTAAHLLYIGRRPSE